MFKLTYKTLLMLPGKRGFCRPFLFFAFCCLPFAGQAQIEERPQLETAPPANPTPQQRPNTPPPPPVTVPDTAKPKPPVSPLPRSNDNTGQPASILNKMFIGGGLSLGFSSTNFYGTNYSIFNVGVSPILGYRITKAFAVGPGFVYDFYRINGNNLKEYGPKVFTQVIVYKQFFLHAEYLNLVSQDFDIDRTGQFLRKRTYTVQSSLAGGGYRQMANDRFGFDLYVLFNIANNSGISNNGPIIRTGFIYNLRK